MLAPSKCRQLEAIYRRHSGALLLALALQFAPGCGDPNLKPVPLVRVRGVVTVHGKPIAKAVVIFESADGSYSYAQTDRRGRYDLWFDSRTRGATTGKKTVRISMNRRIRGLNSHDEGGPGDRAGGKSDKQPPELIPEKYNAKSVLTVEVRPETSRLNFDLKS